MIASQMRGGYYTPIAEARGTISPSQTLPNLDRLGSVVDFHMAVERQFADTFQRCEISI